MQHGKVVMQHNFITLMKHRATGRVWRLLYLLPSFREGRAGRCTILCNWEIGALRQAGAKKGALSWRGIGACRILQPGVRRLHKRQGICCCACKSHRVKCQVSPPHGVGPGETSAL